MAIPILLVNRSDLLLNQGGELDDRTRVSLTRGIEEAGRRAEQRTRAHRAAEADQPVNAIARTIDRVIEFGQRTIKEFTAYLKDTLQAVKQEKTQVGKRERQHMRP